MPAPAIFAVQMVYGCAMVGWAGLMAVVYAERSTPEGQLAEAEELAESIVRVIGVNWTETERMAWIKQRAAAWARGERDCPLMVQAAEQRSRERKAIIAGAVAFEAYNAATIFSA